MKVKLGKKIKLSDISVKVREKELRFVFDKYGDNSLNFELSNLYGKLSNSGYSKTQKGDFVHFILKKDEKIKWKSLHSKEPHIESHPSSGFLNQAASMNELNKSKSPMSTKINLRTN